MQSALRPYSTAGVALVGASVIAVSPVTAPPAAIQEVRDTAVELSALVNPIDVFGPIFQAAVDNARSLGQALAAHPAPILAQILENQFNGIGNIPAAVGAQLGVLPQLPELLSDAATSELANIAGLSGVGQAFLENTIALFTGGALQNQIQLGIDAAQNGDLGGAINALGLIPLLFVAGDGLQNLALSARLIPLLQQPFADAAKLLPIAAGPLANIQAAIGAVPNAALLPVLGAYAAVLLPAVAAGDTIDGLVEAVRNGDPEAAFNTIVTQAGIATKAILDGTLDPIQGGVLPGLQALREAIAAVITTPSFPPAEALSAVGKVPSVAPQSFTLTAPLEKAPTPKAGATTDDESLASIGMGSGTAAASDAGTKELSSEAPPSTEKDNLKGGNLFTPGATSTKGGRHRADTGPGFAQGLKDAAEKTIKGLTGLGSGKSGPSSVSVSKSGDESGSGSSTSGNSSGRK